MVKRAPLYQVGFGKADGKRWHLVPAGVDFRLDEHSVPGVLLGMLGARELDLARVGMAVYVADRLERRSHGKPARGGARDLWLQVEVGDLDFWRSNEIGSLVRLALRQLSGDEWDISFRSGGVVERTAPFLSLHDDPPDVCLYSGGLDSAAGLATWIRARKRPVIAVTANHQPGQRHRVIDQLEAIGRHYRERVCPLVIRTTLAEPPRMSRQELSQRCRSFLFMSLGGAVASTVGSGGVQVFENGVGVMNLPLMNGMLVGPRATRACHPAFLHTMSELVSRVAERPIGFDLPFRHATKAEITRALGQDGPIMTRPLGKDGPIELAASTVSCVHYPLRIEGGAKQCGTCPGCIGRRQAILAAGLAEDATGYVRDLFGDNAVVNNIPSEELVYLKATLMQVAELASLLPDGSRPDIFRRHVMGTGLLQAGEPVAPWVDLMNRYREEWLRIVAWGHSRGWRWAEWLSMRPYAA
jgi:7-cyano-7-deazaguanine synthase in queuosine biosynthesis